MPWHALSSNDCKYIFVDPVVVLKLVNNTARFSRDEAIDLRLRVVMPLRCIHISTPVILPPWHRTMTTMVYVRVLESYCLCPFVMQRLCRYKQNIIFIRCFLEIYIFIYQIFL